MTEAEDIRAAKILARARNLFARDKGTRWVTPGDPAHDEQLRKTQAMYLQRAEEELLAEGKIESVDQS
jgi:hypothetical protein